MGPSDFLQHVHQADRSYADHMSQAHFRTRVLTWPGFSPQLAGDFSDLSGAGGAGGMAHGQ